MVGLVIFNARWVNEHVPHHVHTRDSESVKMTNEWMENVKVHKP